MSNKTFIPAFQCSVGDWKYYICMMKYGEVARQVQFAYELSKNDELGKLIQRGISDRTTEITDYLLSSKHRFLGALVIAAWGGEPHYVPLSMEDPGEMMQGLDREFGVLTFDGTQAYFVLDGQHRLRAIKDAIKNNPDLGKEDICVLIVTHYNNPEGRLRTRRLFSNINRNAKQTGQAENIALDEDDSFAILARRLVEDHTFLSQKDRVKVITYAGDEGELKLAGGSIGKTDSKAFTTLTVLYDVLRYLGGFDLPTSLYKKQERPSDDELDRAYDVLTKRVDDLLTHCGNVRERVESSLSARDIRAPKNAEGNGHPFMRPVVQKAVARALYEICQQKLASWDELMSRLSGLDWRLAAVPWESVYSVDGSKMLSGKENSNLLVNLLHAHLAPRSKKTIQAALKEFKDLKNKDYPYTLDALAKRIPKEESDAPPVPIKPIEELSEEPPSEEDKNRLLTLSFYKLI